MTNPYVMTSPAEVLLAQFGTGVYVATMAVQLQFSPHLDTGWGSGISYTAPSATRIVAALSCECGSVLEVELRGTAAAEIARYCLRTGRCTFVRLPTPEPLCEHWQPAPRNMWRDIESRHEQGLPLPDREAVSERTQDAPQRPLAGGPRLSWRAAAGARVSPPQW